MSEAGSSAAAAVRRAARERLGLRALRPGQLEAAAAAASGRDVLAVLPTGAGKSAIYELAGLVLGRPTVVVSPLIALEEDQLAHLRAAGLTAVLLNSTLSPAERRLALARLAEPETFIFAAPEQLANPETRTALRGARPGLFAVDEAHLISQWGEDFRPDYLRLGAQAEAIGAPVRLALTATAAPPVRDDIVRRLGLRDPEVVLGDFDRPEITLAVRRVNSTVEQRRELGRAARELEGPGIVYAATRENARVARDVLGEAGESVVLYHAGLAAGSRQRAMDAFLGGEARIVAATVAFGMGIDKADVRWVLHVNVPPSLDAYYQEIGRAGRDGRTAHALLLYRPADLAVARHLTPRGVSPRTISKVVGQLAVGPGTSTIAALEEGTGLGARATLGALARLSDAGAVRWGQGEEVLWTNALGAEEAGRACLELLRREREIALSRVEMMRRYAETGACRRSFLLSAFGQRYDGPCGACDNDLRGRTPEPAPQPFPVGGRVRSSRWGEGTVERYDGDQVTVLFDEHGYRDLLVSLVVDRGLLEPA